MFELKNHFETETDKNGNIIHVHFDDGNEYVFEYDENGNVLGLKQTVKTTDSFIEYLK